MLHKVIHDESTKLRVYINQVTLSKITPTVMGPIRNL
jgi:hypothetical protein